MKTLTVAILAAVFLPFSAAFADCRVEHQDQAVCHFPRSNQATDDEDKIPCAGRLIENDGQGAFASYHLIEQIVLPEYVPYETTTSGAESGTACVLEDDDGNEYQIADWTVHIGGECKLQLRVVTLNGVVYRDAPAVAKNWDQARLDRFGVVEVCYSRHEMIVGDPEDVQITQ